MLRPSPHKQPTCEPEERAQDQHLRSPWSGRGCGGLCWRWGVLTQSGSTEGREGRDHP